MLTGEHDAGTTPTLAIRLVQQMSRARILYAFAMVAAALTAPHMALQRPATTYGSISFMALLAIYSYFAADWARKYHRRQLNLTVALTVLGDVLGISVFIYGMGAGHAHFFILLLCDVAFVAIFFHGLELALIVGIVCLAYATVTLQAARSEEAVWLVLVGLMTAIILAWLTHGLGVVLELERVANERLIRYLSQAVCLLSDDGNMLLANPEFERLSQVPLSQVIRRNVTSLCQDDPDSLLARLFDGVEEAVNDRAARETIHEITLATPDTVILRRTIVPCPSAANRVAGRVIVWEDITDIAAAAKAREQGLVVVSHEMRSPLASLSMIAQVLSDVTGELDAEQRTRMLAHLGTETERLARLVASVMDLARFDSPDFELAPTSVELRPLVERLEAMFVPRCEQQDGQFICNVPDGLPTIWADEDRLQQVLINLCDNAVTYNKRGGSVTLSAAVVGDTIRFSVADDGPGIPPEFQERIFDKFDRGELGPVRGQRSHTTGGLGLGLALTKRIVELHGGTIRVESEVGHGATFIVELPLKPPADREPQASPPAGV